MRRIIFINIILSLFVQESFNQPVINEVCSSNKTLLQDFEGDYPDWIEIYNTGNSTINLGNYFMSDNENELTKYRFPNVYLPANSYQIVFASVLRIIATNETLLSSSLVSKSYFINEDKYLPDISLITDSYNLLDWNNGIYVMGPNANPEYPHYGANFWSNKQVPVHIESFIISISLYPFFDIQSQIIDPAIVTELPFEINEGSGIEFSNYQSIWIHNDSDDLPILYQINENGNLIRELELFNLNHIDWEDITQDNAGNYYIGDFGNNFSIRDDLVIYKIPSPDSINPENFNYEEISFSFQDQNEFPPVSEYLNFDCEALFWLNDTLFLFSKNHGTSTFTRMYKIPAIAGDYNLHVVDSFETGGWITAADISPENNRVVLLSEDYFWIFYEFDNTNFFKGKNKKVMISKTQKEGVVFINNDDIYIVDENYSGSSFLYHVNIDSLLNPVYNPEIANKILVYPNPTDSSFKINFYHTFQDSYNLFIYKINGERVFKLYNLVGNKLTINIKLSAGIYYYHLIGRKENYKGKIVIK